MMIFLQSKGEISPEKPLYFDGKYYLVSIDMPDST